MACFLVRPFVHLSIRLSNSGLVTRSFIFCLGVRSPCRITPKTARSSSAGSLGVGVGTLSGMKSFSSAPVNPSVEITSGSSAREAAAFWAGLVLK